MITLQVAGYPAVDATAALQSATPSICLQAQSRSDWQYDFEIQKFLAILSESLAIFGTKNYSMYNNDSLIFITTKPYLTSTTISMTSIAKYALYQCLFFCRIWSLFGCTTQDQSSSFLVETLLMKSKTILALVCHIWTVSECYTSLQVTWSKMCKKWSLLELQSGLM